MANTVATTSVVIAAVDQATEVIQKVTGNFGQLESKWGKLVSALGVTAGVAYLTNLVKQSLEAADAMGDLATSVGVPVETLSKFQLAAEASGTNIETLGKGLSMLSKNMFDVSLGTGEAKDALAALKVNVLDANGQLRKSEDVFLELADKFKGIENTSLRTALAIKVFGEAGTRLLPTLMNGSDGLKDFAETAQALGLVLDSDMVAAADRTNDAIGILGKVTEGLGNQILRQMLPTLEGLAKMFLDAAKSSSSFGTDLANIVDTGFKIFISAAFTAMTALKGFGTILAGVAALATEWAQGNFRAGWEELKLSFKTAEEGAKANRAALDQLWTNTLPNLTQQERAVADAVSQGAIARALSSKESEKARAAKEAEAKKAQELKEKLLDEVAALGRNADASQKLTKAQELMLKVGIALRDGKLQLTEVETKEIFARLQLIDATEKLEEREKALREENEKALQVGLDQLQAIKDRVKELEFENQKIGMTADAVARLTIERERTILAMLNQKLTAWDLSEAERRLVEYQIAQQQKLIDLMNDGLAKQTAVDNAETAAKAWQKAGDDISTALTNALVEGFEGGKSFADSLVDYIKNQFKSLAVTLIIKPIMSSLVGGAMSFLGAPSAATAAMQGVGSGANLLSGASGVLGTFGSVISGIGQGGFIGGFGSAMAGNMSMAAISGLFAEGTASSIAAGLGATVAYAIPYVAAAYAAYRILSGKGTGRDRAPAVGYQGIGQIVNGDFSLQGLNPAFANEYGRTQTDAEMQDYASTVGRSIVLAAANLGGTAGGITIGARRSISEDKSDLASVAIWKGLTGQEWGPEGVWGSENLLYRGTAKDIEGDEAAARFFAEQMPLLIVAGLQEADLAKPLHDWFAALDLESLTAEEATAALETAQAAHDMARATASLGGAFLQLNDISVEARKNILDLTGGLSSFLQLASDYVAQFYTSEEQAAIKGYEVAKVLSEAGIDITGLNTKEEYRALVESLDLTREEDQKKFAALMSVAGQFASLTEFMAANNIDLDQLSSGIVQFMAGIDQIVAGPSDTPEDAEERVAPWLDPLKDAWAFAIDDLKTNLNTTLTEAGEKTAAAIVTAGETMSESVGQFANRPIEVNVTIKPDEVNGGVVA